MFHLNRRMILYLLLLLIGAFTVNAAIHGFQHANRMRQRPDEPIQAWMNIPYIGHSYHVPNAVIATATGLAATLKKVDVTLTVPAAVK